MSQPSSPAGLGDYVRHTAGHRRDGYEERHSLPPSSSPLFHHRTSSYRSEADGQGIACPGVHDSQPHHRLEQQQHRPFRKQHDSQQHTRPQSKASGSTTSIGGTQGLDDNSKEERRKSTSDDKKPSKRPREQYSCVECFRRKQKCDRRFPCNNCIKRRLPERCVPPPSARANLSGSTPHTPVPGAVPAEKAASESPVGPSPAKKTKRNDASWDDRKVEELARTTARIARLERILTVQDPTYIEQRLALAEKAIRAHYSEDDASRAQIGYRARAELSRSSSYVQDDVDQDRPGEEPLDDNEGFLGTSALEAVRLAPQLHDASGKSPGGRSPQELLSYIQPLATRRGFPIPLADVHAIRATLPSREQCDRYFDAFFANYNWSRSPLVGSPIRDRYRQLLSSVPTPSAIRVDAETLPLVALILSTLTLGSVPPAVQPLSSATSHAFFWATKKALVLCETLGLASLDSCWAHSILVRYLDVIRVTRASWHQIGSWIRDALDLGLHRDGSSFRLPKEQVAARRILWSHVLHNDREWSILLGRPLTITFYTTEMPTREDLEPLGFACQTYLLSRNRFTACLEAITQCLQERSVPAVPQGGRTSRSYFRVLEVDDMIAEFVDSLPPYLAPNTTTATKSKVDTSLDEHHPLLPYYRHLINSEVCFYRSLLHRPYLLRPATNGKHPYPESRRICVDTALNDLRARREYAARLTPEETAQTFGGAYAMFNSAIVVGLSLLTAFGLGEKIEHSDLVERLSYLQDYITQLRRNFEAGNVDASAEKERMVMEILLSRLDPILPEDIVKSSRGELAAAAQGSIRTAGTRNPRGMAEPSHLGAATSEQRDDEQQALDSLRLLAGNGSAMPSPHAIPNGAGASMPDPRYTSQQLGSIRNMMSAPMQAPNDAHAAAPSLASLTTMGLVGGAPANPIDPYGWLLTPSGIGGATDDFMSVGAARGAPARTDASTAVHAPGGRSDKRNGGHHGSSGFNTGASTPSNALHHRQSSADTQAHQHHHLPTNGEHDPHFDWEAVLQTIGSGWVGDAMMETEVEALDR